MEKPGFLLQLFREKAGFSNAGLPGFYLQTIAHS
jgi:hypothetical protein